MLTPRTSSLTHLGCTVMDKTCHFLEELDHSAGKVEHSELMMEEDLSGNMEEHIREAYG